MLLYIINIITILLFIIISYNIITIIVFIIILLFQTISFPSLSITPINSSCCLRVVFLKYTSVHVSPQLKNQWLLSAYRIKWIMLSSIQGPVCISSLISFFLKYLLFLWLSRALAVVLRSLAVHGLSVVHVLERGDW